MTVYIEKPSLNLREELASLRNQGSYQERQFYFDNLVTNGTFDADIVGWTNGSSGGGSIAFGTNAINLVTVDSGDAIAYQALTTVIGKTYSVSLDTAVVSGSPAGFFRVGHTVGATQNLNVTVFYGTSYTTTFTATATTSYLALYNYTDGVSTGSFDNISVFETDGTDVVHRMPKGWVPLHVYEDGLLQREGAANDYEVVYDGFDYYVKPAVAPSATTQTCVIGVRK